MVGQSFEVTHFETTADRNKSPAGIKEVKHVNNTFFVKMNFKFRSVRSFGLFLVKDNV